MSRLCLAALVLSALPCLAAERPSLSSAKRWTCYYGRTLPREEYARLDMAVLESDAFEPPSGAGRSGPIKIGYVSVGQVEKSRWYAGLVKDKPFVLEPDPDWPDARRVDVRSAQWQDLLIDQVMPKVLAKGYRGFFLDTIDTAEYLESKDPKKYAGSLASMAAFIVRVRRRFPHALILTNNGLPLLAKIGREIDGAVVEDLYTRYDFGRKTYVKTDPSETRANEAALKSFARKFGRPVFVIVYSKSPKGALAKDGVARSVSAGFRPYVATVSLDKFGGIP
ncbi:MAG: endo alpha-1,4 polygalactosaminidase [Elusimicrobia bacterium]|nr:endo alpha-1,4 polygalactosaminidase [Elusimicrobiota bacterium]